MESKYTQVKTFAHKILLRDFAPHGDKSEDDEHQKHLHPS